MLRLLISSNFCDRVCSELRPSLPLIPARGGGLFPALRSSLRRKRDFQPEVGQSRVDQTLHHAVGVVVEEPENLLVRRHRGPRGWRRRSCRQGVSSGDRDRDQRAGPGRTLRDGRLSPLGETTRGRSAMYDWADQVRSSGKYSDTATQAASRSEPAGKELSVAILRRGACFASDVSPARGRARRQGGCGLAVGIASDKQVGRARQPAGHEASRQARSPSPSAEELDGRARACGGATGRPPASSRAAVEPGLEPELGAEPADEA